MSSLLESLNDDILIYLFSFITIPDILLARQTCKRLLEISKLDVVWRRYIYLIADAGFPVPSELLSMDILCIDLEKRALRHWRIGNKWLSAVSGESISAKLTLEFSAAASTVISDIRFLPGTDGKKLITVSKGIWSVIALWEVGIRSKKLAEWSEKGAIFHRFVVNSDPHSPAKIAVSVFREGTRRIQILGLDWSSKTSNVVFIRVTAIQTSSNPMCLNGDILAFSDDTAETVIQNWKTGAAAILRQPSDVDGIVIHQHDRCVQIMFAHKSILVFRARSIYLFPEPTLRGPELPPLVYAHLGRHSFGWVDGVGVSTQQYLGRESTSRSALSILIRAEVDDPWASYFPTLDFYTLEPNPDFEEVHDELSEMPTSDEFPESTEPVPINPSRVPYLFPPVLRNQVSSIGGPLPCRDIILGSHGTAVWINPHERNTVGLASSEHTIPSSSRFETLTAAVFPGLLNQAQAEETPAPLKAKTLWTNSANNWSSVDYDEKLGKIALGSSGGRVTVLEL